MDGAYPYFWPVDSGVSIYVIPKYSTPYHRKDSMDVSLFFNLSSLVLDDFKNISEGAQHWQE